MATAKLTTKFVNSVKRCHSSAHLSCFLRINILPWHPVVTCDEMMPKLDVARNACDLDIPHIITLKLMVG